MKAQAQVIKATRPPAEMSVAPVMMINEEVYGRLTAAQVGPILDQYLKKG